MLRVNVRVAFTKVRLAALIVFGIVAVYVSVHELGVGVNSLPINVFAASPSVYV